VNLSENNPVKFRKKFVKKDFRTDENVAIESASSEATHRPIVRQPLKTVTNTLSDKIVLGRTSERNLRSNDFILKKLYETITDINDNKSVNLPMDDLPICAVKCESVLLPTPPVLPALLPVPASVQTPVPSSTTIEEQNNDAHDFDETLLKTISSQRINMWTRENELVMPPKGQTCSSCGKLFRNGKDLVIHKKKSHKLKISVR